MKTLLSICSAILLLAACSTYDNTDEVQTEPMDGKRQVDAQGNVIGGGVNIEEDDTTVRATDGHQLTVTDVNTGDTIIKPLPGFGEDTTDFPDE